MPRATGERYVAGVRDSRTAVRERVEDVLPAATLLVMGLAEAWLAAPALEARWHQALLAVVYAGPLAARRRLPVPVLAVVIACGPVLAEVTVRGGVISYVLSAMLAAWTVGRRLDPPATWWGPLLAVGFGWSVFAATGAALSDYVFIAVLYGGAWAVGFAIRRREQRIVELADEAAALRDQQREREARAIAEERMRIARELHDIVSHSLSVVTIQAQAIRCQLGPGQEGAAERLRTVEATARDAGAEMRRLLGVLRAAPDSSLPLAPQPGLGQLPQLLAETEIAGVSVELRTEGRAVPLPPGVDLAAYRVVQEALTNVRRHAAVERCAVVVRYLPGAVEVRVEDAGHGRSRPEGVGHGIPGMAERVALYGGELEVGPREDGGFCVRALLPLRAAPVT
ncbi:MAG: histidine kinase [Blastococcus sp.]|jgi:signal transduction histidine kinase|nr:histidine kinase [Blastococcus sp.]